MQGGPGKQLRKELKASAAQRPAVPSFFSHDWGPVYRVAHACFACRRSVKIAWNPMAYKIVAARCPECGGPLKWMGRTFKTPKRSDTEQWAKVEALWNAGFRFQNYRSHPEAERLPDRLREVDDFVRRNPSHPFRVRP